MKRWKMVFLTAAALVALVSGCKKVEEIESSLPESSESSVSIAEEETVTLPLQLGLLQYNENPSYNSTREAFLNRLEEWGYDETRVSISYQNANGDTAACTAIADGFIGDSADLIVVIASPTLQQIVDSSSSTESRVLFLSPNDITTSFATGIVAPAYPNAIVELSKQASPGYNNLGLLYNPETAAANEIEALKSYCTELEIPLKEQTVTDSAEAAAQMELLCPEAGAIYIPMDYTISAAMTDVAAVALENDRPIYSSESLWTQSGGLASIGFDYTQAGMDLADMAVALLEGRPLSEIPTRTLPASLTYINHETLDRLEKKFPEETMLGARFFN